MYCAKCGKELPDNAKFCPQCGNKMVKAAPVESGSAPTGFALRCKLALLGAASALLALIGRAMDSDAGQSLRNFHWRSSKRLLPGLLALISLLLITSNWLVLMSGQEELSELRYELYDMVDGISWIAGYAGGSFDAEEAREAIYTLTDGKVTPVEWNRFCGKAAELGGGLRSLVREFDAGTAGDLGMLVAFLTAYNILFAACITLGIATVIVRLCGRSLHINRAYFVAQLLHLLYFCCICFVLAANVDALVLRPSLLSIVCVVLAALTGPREAEAASEGARFGCE